jgi:hypothetical protein
VVVVNCGVLFEQKTWVKWAEGLRIILYPVLLTVLVYLNHWPVAWYGASALYLIISGAWYYSIQRKHVLLPAV